MLSSTVGGGGIDRTIVPSEGSSETAKFEFVGLRGWNLDVTDDGDVASDSGRGGSLSRVIFCWVYKLGATVSGLRGVDRSEDLEGLLWLLPLPLLVLEMLLRMSLSLSFPLRTRDDADGGYENGMMSGLGPVEI